ncbi:MAG: response regulator [Gammaproteobacteria bacterium]|jgi:CheY-like chemotaxis protein|nr:response regulator [Gammaproteobacteria bacterium]MBT4605920.1 response regulator [Thiotrichales bacterium]MBT3472680.1 response regulator [Gammaproteobacteria bacterium]MBT4081520.1 response regulator [Gammaproteobacteria bacterium]MBT4328350.1 response regulator [Gammaproteobacteria bacterium]
MIIPNRKILVVDDDIHVLEAYHEILVTAANSETDELMQLLTDGFSLEEDESKQAIDQSADSFELVTANSGKEAISLFKQAFDEGEPFSTVFLDVRMPPGMDGVECSGQLRRIDPRTNIAIVSAYADYSTDEIYTHLGYNFVYLKKPFIPDELFQVARMFSYYWARDIIHTEKLAKLEQQLSQCKQQSGA